MNWRKLFICLAINLLLILTFSGCLRTVEASYQRPVMTSGASQKEDEIPQAFKQYLEDSGERIYTVITLCNNDILVVEEEDGYYWEEIIDNEKYSSTLEYVFVLLSIDSVSGEFITEDVGTGYNEIPFVSIFYQEDGDQYSTDCANFKYWPVENPTDVLVMVYPDPWTTGSYQASAFYGLLPSDSLGTVPVCVQNPEWRNGFPVWVFDVPFDYITEDYRLEYASYVLTGRDILSSSWSPETGRLP